jgi:hypothetical protein
MIVSLFLLRTTQCYARRCYVGLKSLKSLNLTNVYPNNNNNKNKKNKKKNNKVKSKPLELRSRVKSAKFAGLGIFLLQRSERSELGHQPLYLYTFCFGRG